MSTGSRRAELRALVADQHQTVGGVEIDRSFDEFVTIGSARLLREWPGEQHLRSGSAILGERMSGLSGVNHIAFLTSDLSRLAAFYEEMFGAAKVVDLPIPESEGAGRHALISIGAAASLHAFEFSRISPPPAAPMFQRGRIDHFALNVSDAETFEQLRTKLLSRGHTDGTVTDFGVMRVLTFTDPDGHSIELAHWVGGVAPGEIDPSIASDEQRTAQRLAASTDGFS